MTERRALGHGVEEQPPGADATTPLSAGGSLPLPYCYRISRPAPHRPEGEFMMSWGSWDTSPDHSITTVHHAAAYAAMQARQLHTYWGPMTVMVWPHRGADEHYRAVPPGTAYVLQLGDYDQASCTEPEYHNPVYSMCTACHNKKSPAPPAGDAGDSHG